MISRGIHVCAGGGCTFVGVLRVGGCGFDVHHGGGSSEEGRAPIRFSPGRLRCPSGFCFSLYAVSFACVAVLPVV